MMTRRGSGSLRLRGGDQRAIQVSLGADPVSGWSSVRSVTVRDDLEREQRQRELFAAQAWLPAAAAAAAAADGRRAT